MNDDPNDTLDDAALQVASPIPGEVLQASAALPAGIHGQNPPAIPQEGESEVATMNSTPAGKKGSRLLALDGLRALAICLVMVHHYAQDMVKVAFGDRVFFQIANSCWVGVDLFFVLSGFLITGILYDAKGSSSYFRTFYIRRSLRIFPIYYVVLLVIFVVLPALQHSIVDRYTLDHGSWFWLYGSNYLSALVAWPDKAVVHLWSLAIEEHFYLLWPVVVFVASKRQLLIGGAAYVIFAVALRYFAATHGVTPSGIYVMTHYRLDTLVMGGLLALSWRTPAIRSVLARHAGKVAVLLLLVALISLTNTLGLDWRYWSASKLAVGFTIVGLFFVAIHVMCLQLPETSAIYRLLACAPALALGRLSYGMYLFHRPIEAVAINLGLHPSGHVAAGFPSWPYVTVYILGNAAATTAVAWLTWNLFEKHVLRLKDRFIYQNTAAARLETSPAVTIADIEPLK